MQDPTLNGTILQDYLSRFNSIHERKAGLEDLRKRSWKGVVDRLSEFKAVHIDNGTMSEWDIQDLNFLINEYERMGSYVAINNVSDKIKEIAERAPEICSGEIVELCIFGVAVTKVQLDDDNFAYNTGRGVGDTRFENKREVNSDELLLVDNGDDIGTEHEEIDRNKTIKESGKNSGSKRQKKISEGDRKHFITRMDRFCGIVKEFGILDKTDEGYRINKIEFNKFIYYLGCDYFSVSDKECLSEYLYLSDNTRLTKHTITRNIDYLTHKDIPKRPLDEKILKKILGKRYE